MSNRWHENYGCRLLINEGRYIIVDVNLHTAMSKVCLSPYEVEQTISHIGYGLDCL